MLRRRSFLPVSEESPKDAFIAILRSLSGRSDQYFWGLNASEDDGFSIHLLLDLQWQQMRKILKVFQYAGRMGEVSGDGMGRLCEDIGRELCEVSTHRLQRSTQKEKTMDKMNKRLYFIRVGQATQEGDMLKAGVQFENQSLVKFPTHIPKLNKEERERMMKVLVHCKAEDRLECISSFPKQGPTTEEAGPLQTNVTQVDAGPLQTKDVTQVLPSELDDQLFQDIGCIFRGDQEGVEAIISRHERRRLKRLIRMYLDVVLSATLLVLPATKNKVIISFRTT